MENVEIGTRPLSQSDRAMAAISNREDIMNGKERKSSVEVSTGIDCIDRYCRPLSTGTGDFNCLLFAATSTGKSSLMAQMVTHNVFRNLKVAVFLGETNFKGLIEQMAGQLSRVSIDEHDFKNELADRQKHYMDNLEDIASRCGHNLFIYDDRFYIEDIVNRCKTLEIEEGKLDFVVIDHMHCLKTRQKFTDERLKYNYISGQLKPLGIELDCPILCLAQPSRSLKSGDRPPMLSDLKESGNLEDDADRVWALWQPSKDSNGMDQERKSPHPEIKLFQLKFRRGRVTDVTLKLEKQYTVFSEA
jgi:replicative DNA helicase